MITQQPQKIAIIGNSGSGKTTLALKLNAIFALPIIHLDKYAWEPGWGRRPFYEFSLIHDELCKQDTWIMEGNYVKTFKPRIFNADVVIFIDAPRSRCIWQAIKRMICNYGKTNIGLPPNCPEKLDWAFWDFLKWIWNFDRRHRDIILCMLDAYKDKKQIYIVKSPKEIDVAKLFNEN